MSNLPYTQAPAEPSLKDVLDQMRKNIFLSFNCHHIGTVKSFNAAKQTATVTINYKKTYYELNAATRVYEAKLQDYPIMTDCPVVALGGGTAALTMPIQAGDECLVLFNDRDIDNWFQGGAGAQVATPRLHSFADAVVLVGVRSLGKVITGYDAARAVLRNGQAKVAVGASLIEVSNADQNLKELLLQLIDNVKDLVSATAALTVLPGTFNIGGTPVTGTSGTPVNAATISAVATDLDQTADDIAELLE